MAEAAGALEDDSEVSTEELFATAEFRASVLKHYAELSTTALDAEQTAAVEARLKEGAPHALCLLCSCIMQQRKVFNAQNLTVSTGTIPSTASFRELLRHSCDVVRIDMLHARIV
eukprot:2142-Heterococcus_DN1.PRE.1